MFEKGRPLELFHGAAHSRFKAVITGVMHTVIGTLSAVASDCSVASDGDVWPFSILESIATERFAA